jgi:hypothetical protein
MALSGLLAACLSAQARGMAVGGMAAAGVVMDGMADVAATLAMADMAAAIAHLMPAASMDTAAVMLADTVAM